MCRTIGSAGETSKDRRLCALPFLFYSRDIRAAKENRVVAPDGSSFRLRNIMRYVITSYSEISLLPAPVGFVPPGLSLCHFHFPKAILSFSVARRRKMCFHNQAHSDQEEAIGRSGCDDSDYRGGSHVDRSRSPAGREELRNPYEAQGPRDGKQMFLKNLMTVFLSKN